MTDPNDLSCFFTLAWAQLDSVMANRNPVARQVALATVSPAGRPEVRTVVLRHVSSAQSLVEIQTDVASDKVAAVRANGLAEILFWHAASDLQVRLKGDMTVQTGSEVDALWPSIPAPSRLNYGSFPETGTAIGSAYAYEKLGLSKSLAVLRLRVAELDVVEMGDQHRRAVFKEIDGWKGQWLVP